MAVYICTVCDTLYDEAGEGGQWERLPDDWRCPVCESEKAFWNKASGDVPASGSAESLEGALPGETSPPPAEEEGPAKMADALESTMVSIHTMARTGQSIIQPMRTRKPVFSWDDLLIKGAQLARIPLNKEEPVETRTVIGPGAKRPLVIDTPLYIAHMSFGALSREAKVALATGSAAAGTAIGSGEGGILPESRERAFKYIFEYVPNRYSVTEENLYASDAVEIKIGQSAKPGMGGHLPGGKVTREIAEIRGFAEGSDIISPAHFADILTPDDLKRKVAWLRETSGGKPIGIKFAAGHIEADLAVALHAEPDFITLDGRAGGTAASPALVNDAVSIPTLFALHRARKYLDSRNATDVSLVITGGLRLSPDFTKALALGADAVALGTAALMAIGCRQYRICHTGKCPRGITTQDPELRSRLDVAREAEHLANFLKASTAELADFARLTGHASVHDLSVKDLCTSNSEISAHTDIEHV